MASKISFSYIPFNHLDDKTGKLVEIFRPMALIRVSFARGAISRPFDALIDSGSDGNLFPYQLGEILGISFKKIKPKIITGIGNHQIKAYTSKINIWIGNSRFESEADFNHDQMTPLLGRNGFFSLFKSLSFNEAKKMVDIVVKD